MSSVSTRREIYISRKDIIGSNIMANAAAEHMRSVKHLSQEAAELWGELFQELWCLSERGGPDNLHLLGGITEASHHSLEHMEELVFDHTQRLIRKNFVKQFIRNVIRWCHAKYLLPKWIKAPADPFRWPGPSRRLRRIHSRDSMADISEMHATLMEDTVGAKKKKIVRKKVVEKPVKIKGGMLSD